MSFLNSNDSEYLSARITNVGRQMIAQGNFVITNFQIGDSEFDYRFSYLDGSGVVPSQKVFYPLDKDCAVKYPYQLSNSTVTGTTFGNPIQLSQIETITNVMGPAGFVSQYIPFSESPISGSTIECNNCEIDLINLNGSDVINVPTGFTASGTDYITVAFTRLVTENAIITGSSNSLIYRIIDVITGVTYNQIIVDRNTPNLSSSFSGITGTVISNSCVPAFPGPYDTNLTCLPNPPLPGSQQDPWTLEIVWSEKPAGMDVVATNENLTGYTGNIFVSTKEYFGYNTSSGQTSNTGTTITDSFGNNIIVYPEEQHSLAILHYSETNTDTEPDKFYKYEDYISSDNTLYDYNGNEISDETYFEVYIPFIYYHRNTGTTIGARFFMDTTDYYVDSYAMDTQLQQLNYRYLIDEQGISVGKIFTGKKVIIFDDQEIVAALDYKSNRKYTLPLPKVTQVSTDIKCSPTGVLETPLMSGTTGQTLFVTYLFQYTGDTYFNGMHCNYYSKITGTSLNADVSINFNVNDFQYMQSGYTGFLNGYIANSFKILAQLVDTGETPSPDSWYEMDFTSEIPNHTVGNLINPVNMRGARFIITNAEYEAGIRYDIENYLGSFPLEPSPFVPDFGDEEKFPGSIKLVRASDLQVMRFLVNLPDGEFTTSQNPTYISGNDNVITEIALLDNNRNILVIAKTPRPLIRNGTQVFAVKIDL